MTYTWFPLVLYFYPPSQYCCNSKPIFHNAHLCKRFILRLDGTGLARAFEDLQKRTEELCVRATRLMVSPSLGPVFSAHRKTIDLLSKKTGWYFFVYTVICNSMLQNDSPIFEIIG